MLFVRYCNGCYVRSALVNLHRLERGQCEDVLFFVLGSRGARRGEATILVGTASWVGQQLGSPFGTSSWGKVCVS